MEAKSPRQFKRLLKRDLQGAAFEESSLFYFNLFYTYLLLISSFSWRIFNRVQKKII